MANQGLRPVIYLVPVTISKHLAKGKEHRKEIKVSLFHYYSTQSLNNTDPLLLLNYYAIKSFINIYKLEREGLLLVGHQMGEGWLLASWRLALNLAGLWPGARLEGRGCAKSES
jgi:hypothetical protein